MPDTGAPQNPCRKNTEKIRTKKEDRGVLNAPHLPFFFSPGKQKTAFRVDFLRKTEMRLPQKAEPFFCEAERNEPLRFCVFCRRTKIVSLPDIFPPGFRVTGFLPGAFFRPATGLPVEVPVRVYQPVKRLHVEIVAPDVHLVHTVIVRFGVGGMQEKTVGLGDVLGQIVVD